MRGKLYLLGVYKIGDTIESVFDKFPVTDRELKKWAQQMLYGTDGGSEYAYLEYVANSYYSMRIFANDCSATISFSRLEQKVLWVELHKGV